MTCVATFNSGMQLKSKLEVEKSGHKKEWKGEGIICVATFNSGMQLKSI